MPRVQRISLLLAGLLLISVVPKFIGGNSVLVPDQATLRAGIADRLQAQGYTRIPNRLPQAVLIKAARGDCRLTALDMAPEGHTVTWFTGTTAKTGPASFYYRGNRTREFPRIWPPIDAFFQQAGFRLGLNVPRQPVIAVAASPACGDAPLDWSGLQMWGKRVRRAPSTL